MRYMKPHFYDEFSCVADKCPDTCCAGWQIMIDDASLERYGVCDELAGCIDWREGSFRQCAGRCIMLDEQNLCRLISEKGEDWLCDTCNRYPRHTEEFDGVREYSLSLSCPIAAELILNGEQSVSFVEWEDAAEEPLADEFEDFDWMMYTHLEDARGLLFSIVQDDRLSLDCKKRAVLGLARQLQECVDEDRCFDMGDVIAGFDVNAYGESTVDGAERFEHLKTNFTVLKELERLRPEWDSVLSDTQATLYKNGYAAYEDIYREFCETVIGGEQKNRWEKYQEHLLMFFLYTYFCGAVYDDWIYGKAALAIFSVTYIQEFVMSEWFLADKYIDMADWVKIAYRYAREVEHSDDNLNKLEEWFETD